MASTVLLSSAAAPDLVLPTPLGRSNSYTPTTRKPTLRLSTATAVSPRPITFALPSVVPEKRHHQPHSATTSPSTTAVSPVSFLNRIGRRISQSGANLKRKVSSKGHGKPPIRRASEADKENRAGVKQAGNETGDEEKREEVQLEGQADTTLRSQATLKRGLRVSVMRRTKSEGPAQVRMVAPQEEMQEVVVNAAENESEVSSHRGSYFYSNSLGVCWDGRERVHPDAFAFAPYSSNADVLPSPVVAAGDRIVYASTLSSFPPRPPLRPRTPPALELTPASQIVAEYRALHGTLTPSVYSFSDFDSPPMDSEEPTSSSTTTTIEESAVTTKIGSPTSAIDSHLQLPTSEPTRAQLYAKSISNSDKSSAFESNLGDADALARGHSEDSSTSLETMARGGENEDEEEEETTRVQEQQIIVPKEVPRFALVDKGPVPLRLVDDYQNNNNNLSKKSSMAQLSCITASSIESWRDCE